jgi:hypothetical protein
MISETENKFDFAELSCKNFPHNKPQSQIKLCFTSCLRIYLRKNLLSQSYLRTANRNNIICNVCGDIGGKVKTLCRLLCGALQVYVIYL